MTSLWRDAPASVRPMLATTATAPLDSADFVYEPKYDGIRAIAAIDPPGAPKPRSGQGGPSPRRNTQRTPVPGSGPANPPARFWSRLGNEKTAQFPEVAAALEKWGRRLDRPVIVDGEVVALDARGEPAGFQNLQRIHMKGDRPAAERGVAFIVFDLLRDGDEDLRPLPLRQRRARLEALFAGTRDSHLRISEQAVGDGREMHARAKAGGWEGLIAKRHDSIYSSARRSPDWRKLKLVRRQACVIGGWTDPRGSRPFFGALLLGVHDENGRLQYIGHSGAGFSDAELGRVWKRLHALKVKVSPFAATPRTNAPPHWVQPRLVAEVKFTEWTADGRLRHPTYIGLRDDLDPAKVRKEPDTVISAPDQPKRKRVGGQVRLAGSGPNRSHAAERTTKPPMNKAVIKGLLDQVDALEEGGGNGTLQLPSGERLEVSNLRKVFWPKLKLTKGDLFRHYIRVSPFILPVLSARPLVMKRYPNGVDGKPFYQHRAPDTPPVGVRVERLKTGSETRPHIIGGSLLTLLYTAQLASISQDPWFSKIGSDQMVDHVAIDLDPPDGLPFRRVLDIALWVREELEAMKAPSFPKTSGSAGLHIYVPMPPDTPYEAGLLFCQIVATIVARKHPKGATVERSVSARGRRVYVDYLQNIRGKTLASAYSARANDFAGVSTPVTWKEVEEGMSPRDFTIPTFSTRLDAAGDLWAPMRKSKPANLRAAMKYSEQ